MPYIDEAFITKLKQQLEFGDTSAGDKAASTPLPTTALHPWRNASVVDAPAVDLTYQEDHADQVSEVLRKIYRLASFRERSVKELHDRLLREEFEERAVECALAKAQSCGIVNDMRYAEMFVRSRLAAGKGRRGIAADLKALNIDPDAVPGWVEVSSNNFDHEIERALEILRKKPPTSKNKRDSAYRRLISKGYSASAAQSAARLWSESLE